MRLTSKNGWRSPMDSDTINAMYKKLTAYEDTGLEPEAVKSILESLIGAISAEIAEEQGYVEVNRAKEIACAEVEGRMVILPCKVGDALFVTDEGTVLPAVRMVESVTWWNGKISIFAVNKRTGSAYRCRAEDFGKTVFLTREEAEAALKGGLDDVRRTGEAAERKSGCF